MKGESSLAAVMSEIGSRLGAGSGGMTSLGTFNNGFVDSSGTVVCEACARMRLQRYPPNVHKALDSVQFIANHMASRDDDRRVGPSSILVSCFELVKFSCHDHIGKKQATLYQCCSCKQI